MTRVATGPQTICCGMDDGGRRFILVQIPYDTKENQENKQNICRAVTRERILRVVKGYEYTRKSKKGTKTIKVPALKESFNYLQLGDPLFGEYRDFGKKAPDWDTLARYIFYTETSRECDPKKMNEKTGFIGSTEAAGGTSYYLLYTPNEKEDRELSAKTLAAIYKSEQKRAKSLVIYSERIWMHPDELRRFAAEHKISVRPMVAPFNLR
jgi:hypothetical protein